MMRSVETKLLTYLPIERDIPRLPLKIMGAFKGVFDALPGTPTTFGAENGDEVTASEEGREIIGSLYLENNDPKGI